MATDREFNDANDIGKMPFPYKLYQMLSDAHEHGFQDIVSWNANGTSFKVHDSVAFTKTIIPKYFKQTRYKSFQRQLCLYGFDRVLTGNQKGSRYHKKFVRGNYELMTEIKYCVGMKSKAILEQQTKKTEQEPPPKKNQESKIMRPEKSAPVRQENNSNPSQNISLPLLVHSQDSPLHSTTTLPTTLEKETRVISPALSPVSSSNEITPNVDSMSPEDLDDFSLFEGRVFQSFDPSSWKDVDKLDQAAKSATPSLPTSIPTTIELSPVEASNFDPSSYTMLSAASTQELYDAWQQGYEHALSFPLPKTWSY